MLHFDFELILIDCELHTNKRLHRFHAVNAPPEIEPENEKKIIIKTESKRYNFILYTEFSNCY